MASSIVAATAVEEQQLVATGEAAEIPECDRNYVDFLQWLERDYEQCGLTKAEQMVFKTKKGNFGPTGAQLQRATTMLAKRWKFWIVHEMGWQHTVKGRLSVVPSGSRGPQNPFTRQRESRRARQAAKPKVKPTKVMKAMKA